MLLSKDQHTKEVVFILKIFCSQVAIQLGVHSELQPGCYQRATTGHQGAFRGPDS